MKFQDSSFNGLKVTVGTKSVTHAPTNGRSKSNMPHQLFQSWGHKYALYVHVCVIAAEVMSGQSVILTTLFLGKPPGSSLPVLHYFAIN